MFFCDQDNPSMKPILNDKQFKTYSTLSQHPTPKYNPSSFLESL